MSFRMVSMGARGGKARTLAEKIIALYNNVGWTVYVLLLARLEDLTLVAGDVSVWVNHGTGGDAVQAVAGKRLTWNPVGINGKGGLDSPDTTKALRTPVFNATAAKAVVMHVVAQDTDVALRYVAEYGVVAAGKEGFLVRVNNPLDTLEVVGFSGGVQPIGKSPAVHSLATPAVLTGTWDSALATAEVKIRHAGIDVTAVPSVGNSVGLFAANYAYVAGGRWDESGGIAGAHGAHILAGGPGPVPIATVVQVEELLKVSWGL